MKITPLPDTDLACFALLPPDEKRQRLIAFKLGRPTHSWSRFRAVLPGLFNTRKSLFELPKCTWEEIEAAIVRTCRKNPDWLEANLQLAKLLYELNLSRELVAVERQFGVIPIGYGANLKFWTDFYTVQGDRPVISFFDPRRGKGLTKLARKFVFSAMVHNLAVADFADARFEIFQFPVDAEKRRSIRIWEMNDDDIIDLDTLNEKVQETYQIWIEVLMDREAAVRRSGTR